MVSILEKLIEEYQKELLIIIRDKNSHPLQHAQNKKHALVWVNDLLF